MNRPPLQGGATFPLYHLIYRFIWNACWLFLAAWTPTPMHRWRILLLRLAGADVHPSAHIYGSARVWYPPNLSMGADACLGPKVNCYCMAPITLGAGVIVSQGAYLCGGTHDIADPDFTLIVKPIDIGARAWIAAEAFVGPGVTVGERAVLGARAVLFKDAEPNGVYVGNPARLLRQRGIST